jgi:hypothetical protein
MHDWLCRSLSEKIQVQKIASSATQFRQLGDIRRNPSRFIAREQFRRRHSI